jgi:predicted MFS family arabinose efflux permease
MNETDQSLPSTSESTDPSTRATVTAIGAMFFINGAVIFSWLPRIADVRDELGVDNGQLGTALLGMGFGGFVGSLVLPRLMARFRTRELLLAGGTAQAITLPLLAVMPGAIALGLLLAMIGFVDLVTDMSMNTQGVMVQERFGRSIMQRLHGGWSLGSFAGTLLAWLAVAAGLSPRVHFLLVSIVLLVALAVIRNSLIRDDKAPRAPSAQKRRAAPVAAVSICVMAVGVALLESLPNNWAAVSLRDVFHASKRLTGVGSIVFAAAMLTGRMFGDHVLERVGERRLLIGALIMSLVGGAILVATSSLAVGLVGFAVWGLGISVVFPQMYASAATMPGLAAGVGLAAMAIGQRAGFMAEPAVTGRLSNSIDLQPALTIMLIAATVALLASVGLRQFFGNSGPPQKRENIVR